MPSRSCTECAASDPHDQAFIVGQADMLMTNPEASRPHQPARDREAQSGQVGTPTSRDSSTRFYVLIFFASCLKYMSVCLPTFFTRGNDWKILPRGSANSTTPSPIKKCAVCVLAFMCGKNPAPTARLDACTLLAANWNSGCLWGTVHQG